MSRALRVVLAMFVAVGLYQVAVGANGSSMPAPGPGPSAAAPARTPEDMARDAYNSGIEHKDKGVKYEADALKLTAKDREKTLSKAKDEFAKALKDFKRAADLVPSAPQPYNGMGFALRKTGDPAKALEMYDKALQIAPGFPDAMEYRGEAYLALNKIDQAKEAYLALFATDRAQADQLMTAMTAWVAARQAEPAGVDPGVVSSLDSWIKERSKLATLTASMGLKSNQSIWH
jgi:tetratricopeptide (TPR) repeat protein